MRYLLSIILLIAFFFAPFNSKAGTVINNNSAKLTGNKAPAKAAIFYLISEDHVAVINSAEHRSSPVNRYRSFSPADFYRNDDILQRPVTAYVTKHFAAPHLYCETIGSKLLFPKHYFW